MNNIIGVDLGTTHCKIVIAGMDGSIIFSAKKNCHSFTAEAGMHEQDAEAIWQLVLDLLRQAFAHTPAVNVSCVCFSAAMHSLLAVDEHGTPLMHALTWADTRAAKYAATLKASPAGTAIYAQTGTPIHAMSPLCKLLWLKNERPEVFNKAAKFIGIKEYIFYKLTGRYITDYSMASATGLFNIHTKQWHLPSLQLAGIMVNQLSEAVEILYSKASLLQQVKQAAGITGDVPFLPGCSDGAAAQLGSGTLLPNETCVTIGTSGAVRTFMHNAVTHPACKTFAYAFLPGWYLIGGATNNGGNVVQWFPKIFAPGAAGEDSFGAMVALAQQSPAGANGLLFVPYLYGERSPVWDAGATAQFTGLSAARTVHDFARAVLEGVLLNIWEIFQTLPNKTQADTIYANGGFFSNAFTAQMLADISGKKVLLQEDADSSAMGAVYLGMLFNGWIKDIMEVKKFTCADTTFLPQPKTHEIYRTVVERYLKTSQEST
ncbi:MAG TPA: gluconokinase [Chitinophagaceae bacterium]|nr:gluconokinase [Chitinophagaceae bacterium]